MAEPRFERQDQIMFKAKRALAAREAATLTRHCYKKTTPLLGPTFGGLLMSGEICSLELCGSLESVHFDEAATASEGNDDRPIDIEISSPERTATNGGGDDLPNGGDSIDDPGGSGGAPGDPGDDGRGAAAAPTAANGHGSFSDDGDGEKEPPSPHHHKPGGSGSPRSTPAIKSSRLAALPEAKTLSSFADHRMCAPRARKHRSSRRLSHSFALPSRPPVGTRHRSFGASVSLSTSLFAVRIVARSVSASERRQRPRFHARVSLGEEFSRGDCLPVACGRSLLCRGRRSPAVRLAGGRDGNAAAFRAACSAPRALASGTTNRARNRRLRRRRRI